MTKLQRELILLSALFGFMVAGIGTSQWWKSYNGAKQKQNCQSQLKYLGFALTLYAQDFDGKLPDAPSNRPLAKVQ